MRKSLSETWWVGTALALAAAPAVAGSVDQLGARTLADHATDMYASHGTDVDPGLLYGLLYAVAGIGVALWLLVLRSARARSRWSAVLAAATTVVTGSLAAVLLLAREYGEQVFPPVWGLVALLAPAVGVLVVVRLARRQPEPAPA